MLKKQLLYLLLLGPAAGFALLVWAAYLIFNDVYTIWSQGFERSAEVVSFQRKDVERSGFTRYYYRIRIDDTLLTKSFRQRLTVGSAIPVLVKPTAIKQFIPGDRQSSLFQLYSSYIGGHFIAVMILAFYVFIIVGSILACLRLARIIAKNRRLE